ncbi:exosome complex component MTR3-like [Ctenocephalides felis]|uniref:exosome complex component MTR3-like n=1 Tax=Ctenocephalides felis TaxID=7515 RepID=UPI000E6E1A19|nr:exosome complex component MTR3-like [Ctenocephalides felis]XP_026480227.1 exosome complex component MTR3-like [Ctenocephalides felis]
MPVDHKRINGPEVSTPYIIYSKSNIKSNHENLYDILNLQKLRKDGRTPDKHRKVYLRAGIVNKAKGSGYIEVGDTKVIASVFDPREIPRKNEFSVRGQLYCEFKYGSFSCIRRRQLMPDAEEKALSSALCRALQPAVCLHEFPNFQVDVFVLVLENAGSCLSAAITCAGLALADAGVPMYDLVTAATVGVSGNTIVVDPTDWEENICSATIKEKSEENTEHGVIVLAMLPAMQQVSELYHNGCLEFETLGKATDTLVEVNKTIVPIVQQSLVKEVTKLLEDKAKLEVK